MQKSDWCVFCWFSSLDMLREITTLWFSELQQFRIVRCQTDGLRCSGRLSVFCVPKISGSSKPRRGLLLDWVKRDHVVRRQNSPVRNSHCLRLRQRAWPGRREEGGGQLDQLIVARRNLLLAFQVLFGAYPGAASIFAVIVQHSNNETSVYVSSATYACNLDRSLPMNCEVMWLGITKVSCAHLKQQGKKMTETLCHSLKFLNWQLLCACALFTGLFLAFAGHRYFLLSQFIFGFTAGSLGGYILIENLARMSYTWSLIATIAIGMLCAYQTNYLTCIHTQNRSLCLSLQLLPCGWVCGSSSGSRFCPCHYRLFCLDLPPRVASSLLDRWIVPPSSRTRTIGSQSRPSHSSSLSFSFPLQKWVFLPFISIFCRNLLS